jgi:AraC-like DNA-binding protein
MQTSESRDNLFQLISLVVLERKNNDRLKSSDVGELALLEVKRFIAENIYRSELSPEYLAKQFNFSLRYLYNLFEHESVSVAAYIKELRLTTAKIHIVASRARTKTISEIAYSVGFNNVSHFCKVFKIKFNETPMAMRVRLKKTSAIN